MSRVTEGWSRAWPRAVVSVGLLVWLVVALDWRALLTVLAAASWGMALLVIAPSVLNPLLTAVKWQLLLIPTGIRLGYVQLLRTVWISNFFGDYLPTSIGSDAVRMWTVGRASDEPGRAVSSVIMERLTGAASLALLAASGAVYALFRWPGEISVTTEVGVPLAALFVAFLFLWTPFATRMLQGFLSVWEGRPGARFVGHMVDSVLVYRSRVGLLLAAGSIGLGVQLARVVAAWLAAHAVGVPLEFYQALVLVPPALFASLLPISISGFGVREGALVFMLASVDVEPAAALALGVVWGLAMLASNLPGAFLYWRYGLRLAPR